MKAEKIYSLIFVVLFLVPSVSGAKQNCPDKGILLNQYSSFIEGFVRYDNLWMSPIPNATVSLTLNNVAIAQTTSDALGYFIFQDVPPGTYVIKTESQLPIGGVNSVDALFILQANVNMIVLSPMQRWAADVNASGGTANAVDALSIVMFFTGAILGFLIPDWHFETPSVTVDGYNNASIFILGICAGDVNRSNIP